MDQFSSLSNNKNLGNLRESLNLNNKRESLTTEVEILKSPSVLFSVFEYVKENSDVSDKVKENWRFTDWEENKLSIKLQRGTSVLNLAYRDKNKDIIIPVLNMISEEYQRYSGRERERNIEKGSEYLKNQVDIFKKKSKDSLYKVQLFAIEQDLTPLKEVDKGDADIRNIINIEQVRVQAANRIREIDEQLVLLGNLKSLDNILPLSQQILYKTNFLI